MSDAKDFFEDLQARLLEKLTDGDPDDAVRDALLEIRAEWRGTEVYITPHDRRDDRVYRIRQEYAKLIRELCRREGINPKYLKKILRGRCPAERAAQGALL
jgi:hypothetical protein